MKAEKKVGVFLVNIYKKTFHNPHSITDLIKKRKIAKLCNLEKENNLHIK